MASAQVDGTAATKKNVVDLIIGNDVPGTIVTMKVARSGVQAPFEVALKRACTSDLAEKKKMFELFTSLKDKASHAKHDDGSRNIIDEVVNGKACISLVGRACVCRFRAQAPLVRCVSWFDYLVCCMRKGRVADQDIPGCFEAAIDINVWEHDR